MASAFISFPSPFYLNPQKYRIWAFLQSSNISKIKGLYLIKYTSFRMSYFLYKENIIAIKCLIISDVKEPFWSSQLIKYYVHYPSALLIQEKERKI